MPDNYTLWIQVLRWPIYFMTYCIFGWVFESLYCSLKTGKLLNRGFCHGPWLPIYGTGATLLVLTTELFGLTRPLSIYLTGVLGGSLLELLTGWAMYHIFQVRWWDYSRNSFNFHGYICLWSSLAWGLMALLVLRLLHPLVADIPRNWSYSMLLIMNSMLYTLFIEDLISSVIAALDLRAKILRMAENSAEIERLKLNLQDMRERLMSAKEEMDQNISTVKEIQKTEGNVAAVRVVAEESILMTRELAVNAGKAMAERSAAATRAMADTAKDTMLRSREQMEARLSSLLTERRNIPLSLSWWTRTMLENNPQATSPLRDFAALRDAILGRGKDADSSEDRECTESRECTEGREYPEARGDMDNRERTNAMEHTKGKGISNKKGRT